MTLVVDTSYVMNHPFDKEDMVTSPGVLDEIKTLSKYGKLSDKYLDLIRKYNLHGPEDGIRRLHYRSLAMESYKETKRWKSGRCEPLSEADAELIAYALIIEDHGEDVELKSDDKLLIETYDLIRNKKRVSAS